MKCTLDQWRPVLGVEDRTRPGEELAQGWETGLEPTVALFPSDLS